MKNPANTNEPFHSFKVLAVSSAGGHWVELLRLRSALEGHEVVYVSTEKDNQNQVPDNRFYAVPDAHRGQYFRLIRLMLSMLMIIVRERPDVVISTGAAPGYFALRFGRIFGARTLWLDSIANSEVTSLSARLVHRYADLWLTQWPHMAKPEGPIYRGSVL